MVLGIAFQAGKLPFGLADLEMAIKNSVPKAEFSPNWEAFQMGRDWFEKNKMSPVEVSQTQAGHSFEFITQSAALVAYPWQSQEKFKNLLTSYTKLLVEHFPQLSRSFLAQYVHDIIVFDQGKSLPSFYQQAIDLKKIYEGEELSLALRLLAKTYWIKDEVFVSHLMISPLKKSVDEANYRELGAKFEVVHINRPAFDLWGKKIEFDFSPKPWMLKIMRHLRLLRIFMPDWHKKEKSISTSIREQLFKQKQSHHHLKELDSIKGYRDVRYKMADKYLGKIL
jgi:indolepyruvate ferredoxin oxidoreductase